MKKIKLTQNKCALVDNADFEWLNQWKWTYDSTNGYAYRRKHLPSSRKNQKCKKIYMHRLINQTPPKVPTDHINRDRLDNRRANLRTVTSSQNSINSGLRSDNKSGCKGVYWDSATNKWGAEIKVNHKRIILGKFTDLQSAVEIRKNAEKVYHDSHI